MVSHELRSKGKYGKIIEEKIKEREMNEFFFKLLLAFLGFSLAVSKDVKGLAYSAVYIAL